MRRTGARFFQATQVHLPPKVSLSVMRMIQDLQLTTLPGLARRDYSATVRAAKHYPTMSDQTTDHTYSEKRFTRRELPTGKYTLTPMSQVDMDDESLKKTEIDIASLNTMMRLRISPGKTPDAPPRSNSAWMKEETLKQYQQRTAANGAAMGRRIAMNPRIGILFIQEAANTEENLKIYERALSESSPREINIIESTDWGILTAYDPKMFPEGLVKLGTVYSGSMASLNTRVATFSLEGYETQITNLHLPHDNPEEALEVIANSIAITIANQIIQGKLDHTQIFIGDWNLPPDVVEDVVNHKIEKLFPRELDIQIKLNLEYNKEGHLKRSGDLRTVDHALTAEYKLAPEHLKIAQHMAKNYIESTSEYTPSSPSLD